MSTKKLLRRNKPNYDRYYSFLNTCADMREITREYYRMMNHLSYHVNLHATVEYERLHEYQEEIKQLALQRWHLRKQLMQKKQLYNEKQVIARKIQKNFGIEHNELQRHLNNEQHQLQRLWSQYRKAVRHNDRARSVNQQYNQLITERDQLRSSQDIDWERYDSIVIQLTRVHYQELVDINSILSEIEDKKNTINILEEQYNEEHKKYEQQLSKIKTFEQKMKELFAQINSIRSEINQINEKIEEHQWNVHRRLREYQKIKKYANDGLFNEMVEITQKLDRFFGEHPNMKYLLGTEYNNVNRLTIDTKIKLQLRKYQFNE